MNTDLRIQNLQAVLEELNKADKWLERSYSKCRDFDMEADLNEQQYDDIEAYTSRFSRVSDLLLQKVFRSIDAVELELGGTLLDAVHRAEKRGIVESAEDIRRIRELRNEIAHEYLSENLIDFFYEIKRLTPVLRQIIVEVRRYCARYQ